MTAVRWLVAGDPDQRTGGYLYDARIVKGLRRLGWRVDVQGLAGRFPWADRQAADALEAALQASAAGDCVVLDGLVSGDLPDVVGRHAARLQLIALIHHPLADERGISPVQAQRLLDAERRVLSQVRHVVVTSRFTARRLQAAYGVAGDRISVVEPGTDRPRAARPGGADETDSFRGRFAGGPAPSDPARPLQLLCVASVTPRKGHEVLVAALARIADLSWRCDCLGDTSRDAACVARVRAAIERHGLASRMGLPGVQSAAALAKAYATADVFVLPSWYEGYGMVVTEALSYGLPVITTTGGALADTLPAQAGIAVAPGDVGALAGALRQVVSDSQRREQLCAGARRAALTLPDWETQTSRFARALQGCCQGEIAKEAH